MLLSAQQLTKTYGARTLLGGVSLYLERGNKLGVIGVNGAGKSTLLRLLAGEDTPESGAVTRDPNVRVNYLSQNPTFRAENTVLQQVFEGLSPEARELAEYEAKTILTKLRVTCFEQPVGQLSGGQRKRVGLASALVHPCDVLILDEPTNHLDFDMVCWLEDYLRRFSGALVMVTHDRYFLERVTNRIVEVEGGNLYFYEGNYSKFLEIKAQRAEMETASERKRQSILRREYQWVMQGAKARGTKSRDRLERYDALKNQAGAQEKETLTLSAMASRLGKKTVELHGVTKRFGDRTVLKDFDCMLLRDDRIGIVGENGSGKSTLLNLIAGRFLPDEGEVILGDTVKIGYFCQENPDMDGAQSVLAYVQDIAREIETPEGVLTASQLLEKFLFSGETQWSPVEKLSGGEKRRLFLLSVLVTAPNVLLLDEPTNDLDIETLTILEDYLDTFPGAVLAVSHDRYFLERVTRRVFAVEENGAVRAYAGGYADYLEASRAQARAKTPRAESGEKKERTGGAQKLKFTFKEQHEYDGIDAAIEQLDAQIAQLVRAQAQKADDYVALGALQAEQTQLEGVLAEKTDRWLYLTDLAERIEQQKNL